MAKSPMAEFFGGFKKFDINNDMGQPGIWPPIVKLLSMVLMFVAIVAATWHFIITDKQDVLALAEAREQTLKSQYEAKARRAANKEAYQQQLDIVRANFQSALDRLPDAAGIGELNQDIGASARQAGLEVDDQVMKDAQIKELFIEQPVELILTGTFHEMGNFVSAVAELPRIVTLHDFNIEQANSSSPGELTMSIQTKTYRYKDPQE